MGTGSSAAEMRGEEREVMEGKSAVKGSVSRSVLSVGRGSLGEPGVFMCGLEP